VLRHGCSDTRAQGALDAIRNKDGNKKKYRVSFIERFNMSAVGDL